MRYAISISVLITLCLCLNCNYAIAGGPWKGKIIDVETKEPLEGVVVLAVWERVYRTPAGDNSYFYEAKETTTNKAGEFEIPSYTPINLLPLISYMRGPFFTIFKPSYGSVNGQLMGSYFANKTQDEQDFEIKGKRYRFANGIVELPKLQTREERLQMISLPTSIPDDKMPRLIETINKEAIALGLKPSRLPGRAK